MARSTGKQRTMAALAEETGSESSSDVIGVPDLIYDTVVSAILDRALDPGTKLPEEVFCSHYGVSRTIVRIAILRLQYDKLVEIQRNRGCFVVVPSTAEAVDVLGGRKAIEPSIVRRVGEIGSEENLAALHAHLELEDEAYRRNDHRAALRLSGQFHVLLANFAKNRCLSDFLHNLICRSALLIATYSNVVSCCKTHEHRRIVDLLAARNIDEAAREMTTHLDHIERDLLHVKQSDEKASLESVLARYTKTATPHSPESRPHPAAAPGT